MARILITGGAGFIGVHLAEMLIQKKNSVLIVDKKSLLGGIFFINKKAKFIKGDILNSKIIKKIEKWKPQIIYHLAAQSAGESAYDDPKDDYLTNGYGTYLIAKLAKKIKCKYFIYASSVAVYGSNPQKKITEKSPINPDSIYGISNFAGEMFVKQLLLKSKTKVRIIRIFNTFGPGQNILNLKKGMVGIYSYYVWAKKPIVVKGSLKRFRNLVFIDDCIKILFKCLNNKKLKKFETINLTSAKKTSVRDLINTILKVNNLKNYPIKIKKGTKGDSFGFNSSNNLLKKKIYGFKFTELNTGLSIFFNWINKLNTKNIKNSHPLKLK